jgi:hypothetical protein
MAGHWIPWECGLTRKREVVIIARSLEVSRREAAALCMEVWEWAQDQSIDGLIVGMNPGDISEAVSVPGIGEAMEGAGWLLRGDGNVQFPNWQRFNARSAKLRLQAAERKRRYDAQHKVTRTPLQA